MITVRLPAMLRPGAADTLVVTDAVTNVAGLVDVLAGRLPALRGYLDDAVLNFAVNDELILHDAMRQALEDGDTVELVPTISGGVG